MHNKYEKVNWEDFPSTKTPVNAKNLGIMDQGIYDLDRYVDNTIGGLAYESMLGKNFDDFRGGGENLIPNGWDSFEPYGSGINYVNNWNFESDDLTGWGTLYSTNVIENNNLVMKFRREEPTGTKNFQYNSEIPAGTKFIVRLKYFTNTPLQTYFWSGVQGHVNQHLKVGEWDVMKMEVTSSSAKQTFRFYDFETGFEGKYIIIDWIQITPVDNQHLVVEKTPLENGLTRIQTWGGNSNIKLHAVVRGDFNKGVTQNRSLYLESNGVHVVRFDQDGGTFDDNPRAEWPAGELGYKEFTGVFSNDRVAANVFIRTYADTADFIASDPIVNVGDKPSRTPLVKETGNTKYRYKIKFYGEGEEILSYKGDSVIEKGKEYSYVLSLKNTAEDLRLRDNLSGRTIKIKQGEQLIEYTGIAQKTEKVDFTLLSKDKDLELEINPPRMVQGSYVTIEPIRDSYNTVVERSNKLEEELGQHRFKELPNLIPDGWNSFEPYGSTENLIENGWGNFVPYGYEGEETRAPIEVFEENYAQNELRNGDFRRGIDNWGQTSIGLKAYEKGVRCEVVGNNVNARLTQFVRAKKDDVYYVNIKITPNKQGRLAINLGGIEVISNSVEVGQTRHYSKKRIVGQDTEITWIIHDTSNYDIGEFFNVHHVQLVNLTKLYGKGNEPSQEWCDTNLKYYSNWNDIPLENKPVKAWDNMAVHMTPLGGGLTRIQTWGGNSNIKLLHSKDGTDEYITTSVYVKNNLKKEAIIVHPNTYGDSVQVPPSTESYVITGGKRKVDAALLNTMIRTGKPSDSLDFIASDPVINTGSNPSLNIYREDLKNGLTEIKTWGGTGNTKLWYKSDAVSGELTNSVYIKNKGNVPVGVHGFGEKYDYVQPGEERVVTQTTSGGSPMLQILGGEGNLHFIAGPPKIVEGKEGQPPFTPEQILGQVAGPRGYLDLLRRVEELERIIKDNTRVLEAEIIEEE